MPTKYQPPKNNKEDIAPRSSFYRFLQDTKAEVLRIKRNFEIVRNTDKKEHVKKINKKYF